MCPSDRYSDDEPPKHVGPPSGQAAPSGLAGFAVPSDRVLMDGSYRWVMQRCAVGLAVLDMGGEFLEANPAFCDLTGYSHDALSVPGFMFEKMLLTDEIASYRKHLVALSNGEEESYHQPQRIVRPGEIREGQDDIDRRGCAGGVGGRSRD